MSCLRQRFHSLQLLHPPLMTHRRNQRHLQGWLILIHENGQSNFNFQQGKLVHVKNPRGIQPGSSSTMVNGLQKNMKKSCVKQHRQVTYMHGIEKLVKKPKGIIKSLCQKHGRMEGTSRKSRLQRPSISSSWSTSQTNFIHASSSRCSRCSSSE